MKNRKNFTRDDIFGKSSACNQLIKACFLDSTVDFVSFPLFEPIIVKMIPIMLDVVAIATPPKRVRIPFVASALYASYAALYSSVPGSTPRGAVNGVSKFQSAPVTTKEPAPKMMPIIVPIRPKYIGIGI